MDKSNYVFQSSEKASYHIYYKWGFIWLNAGFANFETNINNNNIHFKSTGETWPSYDWIFKVRDIYQSKVDYSSFSSLWFNRNTSEGKYKVNNTYVFDTATQVIYTDINNSGKEAKQDTLYIERDTYDVLSAIYWCRNIDFSILQINDTVPITTVIDNEIHNLYIRYLGKEDIELKNNNKYSCIKFNILLVKGTLFRGGEQMTVWVTDDKNHVPVWVEAKILVGSIQAVLVDIQNNKYPLKTLVE